MIGFVTTAETATEANALLQSAAPFLTLGKMPLSTGGVFVPFDDSTEQIAKGGVAIADLPAIERVVEMLGGLAARVEVDESQLMQVTE